MRVPVRPHRGNIGAVDLEEHTIESVPARCEECGATLTDQELQVALEQGGPALCTVHATELADAGSVAGEVDEADTAR